MKVWNSCARRVVALTELCSTTDREDSVVTHRELAFWHTNGALIAENGIIRAGDQGSIGAQVEISGARVANAISCLHGEEGVAFDGEVERIVGALQRTLGEVRRCGTDDSISVDGAVEASIGNDSRDELVEDFALSAISGGAGVREVVGREVKCLGSAD